jgi:hypothetical protein
LGHQKSISRKFPVMGLTKPLLFLAFCIISIFRQNKLLICTKGTEKGREENMGRKGEREEGKGERDSKRKEM